MPSRLSVAIRINCLGHALIRCCLLQKALVFSDVRRKIKGWGQGYGCWVFMGYLLRCCGGAGGRALLLFLGLSEGATHGETLKPLRPKNLAPTTSAWNQPSGPPCLPSRLLIQNHHRI